MPTLESDHETLLLIQEELQEHVGRDLGGEWAQGGTPHKNLRSEIIELVRLILTGQLEDLARAVDGTLEYRSDTDKFRGYAAGAWANLATEGWVTGSGSTLTIATGVITVTGRWHLVDTEAAAATDDLATINGTTAGQVYVFQAADSARDVVFKDGTGNLKMAGDFTANNVEDTITFISNGTNLYELARSDNGA